MTAIFKREFKSYFTTPVGLIFIAAVYFFLGLLFHNMYSMGLAQVHLVVASMSSIILYIVPILTMRIMSEDKKQKVDQLLLTAPVKLVSIVMGKFFAALAVFAISFAPTVIFEGIVLSSAAEAEVSVPIMYYVYSLIGIMLLGGALISIGMFVSSLTESTAISAILTLAINILVSFCPYFASIISTNWISKVITSLSFIDRFENFSQNIFSFTDILYFLSIIAIFLFLSIRSLEKKRWS